MKVWDLKSGRYIVTLRGHKLPIESLAISADGKTAVSCCDWDQIIKVWDTFTPPFTGWAANQLLLQHHYP
ncbi:MAG: hypothetical protein GY845_37025 [Planctomycetes bacterium]|nr:hypothetical protein [Planctomycetota bacterium]